MSSEGSRERRRIDRGLIADRGPTNDRGVIADRPLTADRRLTADQQGKLSAWLRGVDEGRLTRRAFVMRAAALGISTSAIAMALAACGGGDDDGTSPTAIDTTKPQTLLFHNWSEYTSPKVMRDFEQKTGIKVDLTLYDSNDQLSRELKAGDGPWDVIVPSDSWVTVFTKAGLIQPLDMSLIPNFDTYVTTPLFHEPSYDPGTDGKKYSTPYMFGTQGFGVRLDVIPDPPESYAPLYDPKYKQKISMLDGSHEVLGPALLMLGYSWNSTSQSELDEATAMAIDQKPLVTAYDSAKMGQRMIDGLPLVECWDGDAVLVMNKIGINKIRYVLPSEGYNVFIDNFCVPKNAPSAYGAHLFMNFMLDPANAAASSDYTGYQSTVESADPLVKSLVQRAMRPTSDVIARGVVAEDLGSFEDAYQKAYAEVRKS
jgi:spermidine/putrescine-binding protein